MAVLLGRRFPQSTICIDVDSIEPGVDYIREMDAAIPTCAVVLVLVGQHWLERTGLGRRPRPRTRTDPVRLEMRTALKHGIRILPVLDDGAQMPKTRRLPTDIRGLATLNPVQLHRPSLAGHRSRSTRQLDRETPGAGPDSARFTPLEAVARKQPVAMDRRRSIGLPTRSRHRPLRSWCFWS